MRKYAGTKSGTESFKGGPDPFGIFQTFRAWYEGEAKPPGDIAKELPMNGSLFIGSQGRIAIEHDKFPKLLPEGGDRQVKRAHLGVELGPT